MVDRRTAAAYETQADEWIRTSHARHEMALAWLEDQRVGGPVVDLGSGPGWHLQPLSEPRIGLDVARPMAMATRAATAAPVVVASAGRLPFRPRSLGGVVASRVHTHLPLVDNPRALAELHRTLEPDSPVLFQFVAADEPSQGWGHESRSENRLAGRLFSCWTDQGLDDLLEGAGFEPVRDGPTGHEPGDAPVVCCRRRFTLPDTVGAGMRLLICGLNPSEYSAEVGVGFGRPGNRFWPAALAAGLATVDRDPFHALDQHGLGMTDLVKRATRRASELSTDEYAAGLNRVERLVAWLKPAAVCFVGLAGWRAVVDRRARAGRQTDDLGGRPVYLMPSTSGLNAHSRLDDLTEHLANAARLADQGI